MKTTHAKHNILVMVTACLLFVSQAVYAIDLQTAKNQGLVGETISGYLEAVNAPSAETRALIKDINDQRRQKYREIASRNNTSLQTVEQLAGKKAIEKSEPGSYIRLNGTWQKK